MIASGSRALSLAIPTPGLFAGHLSSSADNESPTTVTRLERLSQTCGVERVAKAWVAGVETALEPAHTLLRGAM